MRLTSRIGQTRLTLAVFTAVALCGAPLVLRVGAQDGLEPLRARIRALVDSGKIPSLVFAVGRDGRIVASEAFGWADRDRRIAATPQTPYSVASVTKPFTATALMILNERQQVALDQPVTQYLGPLDRPGVAAPSEVTLRRTLGHMAGFPIHNQYFYEDGKRRPLPFAETMRCFGAEIQPPGSSVHLFESGLRSSGPDDRACIGSKLRGISRGRSLFASRSCEHGHRRVHERRRGCSRAVRHGRRAPAFFCHGFPGWVGTALDRRRSRSVRSIPFRRRDAEQPCRAHAGVDRRDAGAGADGRVHARMVGERHLARAPPDHLA